MKKLLDLKLQDTAPSGASSARFSARSFLFLAQGSGFRVWGSGFGVKGVGFGFGYLRRTSAGVRVRPRVARERRRCDFTIQGHLAHKKPLTSRNLQQDHT